MDLNNAERRYVKCFMLSFIVLNVSKLSAVLPCFLKPSAITPNVVKLRVITQIVMAPFL